MDHWQEIESHFLNALDLGSAERTAYLQQLAQEDAQLAEEVRSMLHANAAESRLIEQRLLGHAETESAGVGELYGPFRAVELIGEGGMGRVFRGERDDGTVRQVVAIKVLRNHLLASDHRERFALERQVLASLNHPNIAGLIDGGVAANGQPYIALQYVAGQPITEYCDSHRLGVDERLDLFLTACDAVAFAHAHLVVHRDIKNSNILVSEDGHVSLLDFGIAKLLMPEALAQPAARTATSLHVLTPLHAAPEQFQRAVVTTATDVYALGLLLFELLAGRYPYKIDSHSAAHIEQAISTQIPARLSSELADTVAERRSTTSKRLRRVLQGDIERIVAMALRKEPERRYSSAADLADDLRRFRRGLPVRAHGDSLAYRVQRFVSRNTAASVAGFTAAVLLAVFAIYAGWQSRVLAEERDRLALERDKTEAVISTLVRLFDTSRADIAQASTMNIAEFLDDADAEVEGLVDQPAVQARLQAVLGEIHLSRGNPQRAAPLLEAAWSFEERRGDPSSTEGRKLFDALASATFEVGDRERSEQLFREALDFSRTRHGTNSAQTAQSLHDLARVLEPAESLDVLAEALAIRRQLDPPDTVGVAASLNDLARSHERLRDTSRARALFEEALAITERELGRTHPSTLEVMHNIAAVIADPEERVTALVELRERAGEVHSNEGSLVAQVENNLGVAYALSGQLDEAGEAFRRGYDLFLAANGPEYEDTGNAARNVARLYQLVGRLDESRSYFERALEASIHARRRSEIESQYSIVLMLDGALDDARAAASRGFQLLRQSPLAEGMHDRMLAANNVRYGRLLWAAGDVKGARSVLEDALSAFGEDAQANTMLVAEAHCTLGAMLLAEGQVETARSHLRAGFEPYASFPLADPVVRDRCADSKNKLP